MLQEFILGKKVPFFFLFSMPWEMSSSRNVPKSCLWMREDVLEQGPACPAPIPVPSRDQLFGLWLPRGTPSLLPKLCPELPGKWGQPSPTAAPSPAPLLLGTTAAEAEGRERKPGEGQAVHGAAPAAEALGFMSSWLYQWPLPFPALDGVTRNAGSPGPVVCHHLNLSLIASQSNLLFPNIKAPRVTLGEAELTLRIPVPPLPPALPARGGRTPSLAAAGSPGRLSPHVLAHRAEPASACVRSAVCFGNGLAPCGGSGLRLGLLDSWTFILSRAMNLRWGCESKGRKSSDIACGMRRQLFPVEIQVGFVLSAPLRRWLDAFFQAQHHITDHFTGLIMGQKRLQAEGSVFAHGFAMADLRGVCLTCGEGRVGRSGSGEELGCLRKVLANPPACRAFTQ